MKVMMQYKELPVECPKCNTERQDVGIKKFCKNCNEFQITPLVVLGKEFNPTNYDHLMDAVNFVFQELLATSVTIQDLGEGMSGVIMLQSMATSLYKEKVDFLNTVMQDLAAKSELMWKHGGFDEIVKKLNERPKPDNPGDVGVK